VIGSRRAKKVNTNHVWSLDQLEIILLHEYLHRESQLHLQSQARLLALKQLVFRLYQESGSY
jgi:hypothetical protein